MSESLTLTRISNAHVYTHTHTIEAPVFCAIECILHKQSHTHLFLSFNIVLASALSWLNNNKVLIHTHAHSKLAGGPGFAIFRGDGDSSLASPSLSTFRALEREARPRLGNLVVN